MTYQVLARKWRPRTFSELVGQKHVITALTNSILNQKTHHAYLFTGTRGVGKTTIARVFAKALNCEKGPTPTPCLTCATCVSIAEGRYVDLIEVDAASRTRVEDTKELLDNVQYMPTQGRYKIYLIDEIHMLSGHSFNALLKTLEEPPAHVMFLLATTDPQKIPVTVLSRCLQFTLKPLSVDDIASYLAVVLKGEGIAFETKALTLLAKAARGSLRDSLSLLDQAIAYAGSTIEYSLVLSMLGTVDDECVYRILAAIANDNGDDVLAACQSMMSDGVDFSQVLERFIDVLHRIVMMQCVASFCAHPDNALLLPFSTHFLKEDIQLFYEICLNGRQALGSVPHTAMGFEMTMFRMMSFKLSEPKPLSLSPLRADVTTGGSKANNDAPVIELTAKQPALTLSPQPKPLMTNEMNRLSLAQPNSGNNKGEQDAPHFNRTQSVLPNPLHSETFKMDSAMERNALEPITPLSVQRFESPLIIEPVVKDSGDEALSWRDVVELLPLAGMAKTVIMHCNLIEKIEGRVRLGIEPNYQAMLTSTAKLNIETALKRFWKCEFKLYFKVLSNTEVDTPAAVKTRAHDESLKQAKASLSDDACLNEILNQFDGKIDEGSTTLIKD